MSLASINTHHGVLVGQPVDDTSDRDNVAPKSGDPETATTQDEAQNGASSKNSSDRSESSAKSETTSFAESKKGDERVIDILHSVVFAGCPFRTGVGFLRDLMVCLITQFYLFV